MHRRFKVLLLLLFAGTGFSALTLQVVWQRVISLHAGVDLFSITTVVSAFLAGLGLGSLLGGVPSSVAAVDGVLSAFAFNFGLLIVPTTLMGLSPSPPGAWSSGSMKLRRWWAVSTPRTPSVPDWAPASGGARAAS